MKLTGRDKRKLTSTILLIIASGFIGLIFSVIKFGYSHRTILQGVLIGMLVSTLISVFEGYIYDRYFRKLSFILSLLVRTSYYVISTSLAILTTVTLVSGRSPIDIITDEKFLIGIIFSLMMCTVINFFLIINRMLGRKVLLNFILGKYHKPVEEERIFMFLDLNDSTTIAEKIGHTGFHRLLSDFFFSLSDPIAESEAEIYQYVGDEVVIVWNMKNGIRNANCINVFFNCTNKIEEERDIYKKKYGFVPRFKAGLHCGKVVVGEIGDYKREITYLGDVVNTAARIRSQCGEDNKGFLASGKLLSHVSLPENINKESLGKVKMKGKEEELELFSLTTEKEV